MNRPVMVLAEEEHVRKIGLAALGPVDDVVRGTPRGRTLATVLRNSPAIKAVGSQLNQAVCVTALAASVIAVAVSLGERFECGPYGCPCRRVEGSLDVQRSIVAVGEAQVALLGGLALCLGHTIRIGSVPGVHRVIPEAADAAFHRGLQEWRFVKWLSALRVRNRLGVTRDDGGMREADAAVSHGFDRF